MLEGKKLLITGVIRRDSIAFEVARRAQEHGAEVLLTGFGRTKRMTERAAERLEQVPDVLELDVNSPEDLAAVTAEIKERWGKVDGVLHAIAYAPGDALGGNFMDTPGDSAVMAFRTSAYSLQALASALRPVLANGNGDGKGGASIVALDFDATVAWPAYDFMGVAKAALESVARYLARDLGPFGVRVNCVSAGPIDTMAAGGIPGFDQLAEAWDRQAPLGWNTADATPVADTTCFLLSALSAGITGEIVHVDGGYHAMGAPLR
jgi:enoyl-[acyl-carrier protein] reductase I